MNNDARLKEFLSQEAARRRKAAITSLVVGILVAVIIAIYLGVLTHLLAKELEPKKLVEAGYGLLSPQLEDLSAQAESYALDTVPQLLDSLKDQIVERTPELRLKAQELLEGQLDTLAIKMREALSAQMVDLLSKHKDIIDKGLEHFGDADAEKELRLSLEALFEEVARNELDKDLPVYLSLLEDLNEKLKTYVNPTGLSEEQLLERELIIIAKELRTRYLGG